MKLRGFYLSVRGPALIGFAFGAIGVGIFAFSPFSPMMTVWHIAASPNCAAARAVGLAPARRGEPGYFATHDADNDGRACEPFRGSR